MSDKDTLKTLKGYQKSSKSKRAKYLRDFEEKMIYRTTKTENPETTPKMVREVLHKFRQA